YRCPWHRHRRSDPYREFRAARGCGNLCSPDWTHGTRRQRRCRDFILRGRRTRLAEVDRKTGEVPSRGHERRCLRQSGQAGNESRFAMKKKKTLPLPYAALTKDTRFAGTFEVLVPDAERVKPHRI